MPGGKRAYRLENVVLDKIEDRDAPFLLDIGVAPQDSRFVELDMRDARVRHDAMALYALATGAGKSECGYPQAVDENRTIPRLLANAGKRIVRRLMPQDQLLRSVAVATDSVEGRSLPSNVEAE